MKKVLFLASVFLTAYVVQAQDITAVTGLTKGKIEFNDFRTINSNDLNTSSILLSKTDKVNMDNAETEIVKICSCGKYIAAMTETKNGDILYIPMHNSKLALINTASKSGAMYDIPDSKLDIKDQSTFFARMTTAPDGYSYALNNAGTEFLRISANGTIQNLGAVQQFVEKSKSFAVETAVYGGDMFADAFGNIYVISASQNVFKINPKSLNTEFLGQIKGLPENYTVNGAAVEKDGSVLLATTSQNGLYSLNMETLEAKFKADYQFAVYDLSSPYFLLQKKFDELNNLSGYSLYPTVVKNSELNIVSNSKEKSVLSVSIWNLNETKVFSSTVNVKSAGDYQLNLNGSLSPGIYVLKAVNQDGKVVINTKFTLVK